MEGFTVWFTGLPSSGKSTLARMLERELSQRGFRVAVLDGDEVRRGLSRDLGFSKEDRDENIRRIAFVARLLTQCGAVAIACAISPYREVRDEARRNIGRFVEVYVKCPVEVCQKRDTKGLYAKALRGEIPNFTGISDPYEEPLNPEVVVETDKETPEESLDKILSALERLGYIGQEEAAFVQVPIPRYLHDELEKVVGRSSFADVPSYVVYLITRELQESSYAEEMSAEEKELIKAKLRSLGYLD